MAEWMDIETAPRDGDAIQLCFANKDSYRVYSPCMWSQAGEISEHGFWLWWQADPQWFVEITPTHWQPLPAPPELKGE